MDGRQKTNLSERVERAAQSVLDHEGAVGVIELLQAINFLSHSAVELWRKRHADFESLQKHIQCGEKKLDLTYKHFQEWVDRNSLESFMGSYASASPSGPETLQVSVDGNPKIEAFFKTKFRPSNLTAAKKTRIEKKFNKPPDLVVFQMTSQSAVCCECDCEMEKGDLMLLKNDTPLCLQCADMDHLEFLASGHATLTRRARKASSLSAIVLRFNRRRKRYERLGILVVSEAIDTAEAQCAADAPQRARRREQDVGRREKVDKRLVEQMAEMIRADFPGCPPGEASEIAAHTAVRGSGRVGRSAAGRDLDQAAIRLAVRAWIRHQHTEYDRLLMRGVERHAARQQISEELETVVCRWS